MFSAVRRRLLAAAPPDTLAAELQPHETWELVERDLRRGRITDAEERLAIAENHEGDPRHQFVLGRLAEERGNAAEEADRARQWREAQGHYRQFLADSPDDAEGHYRLGLMQERLKEWDAAAASFGRAVDLRPDQETWLYRWAWVLQLGGRKAESTTAYRLALEAGSNNPAFLYDMLAMESEDFLFRQRVGNFVRDEWPAIDALAGELRSGLHTDLTDPVFVYWAQGFDQAPPLVRACLEQVRRVVPPERLHVLDERTWPFYVDLSDPLKALQGSDRVHFSDVLRSALLARHGGVWLDATCVLRDDALTELDGLREQDFFAFRYEGPRISSWFLTSRPGGYVASVQLAALTRYWDRFSRKQGYFLFHHLFESLYWADPEFRRRWDAGDSRPTATPHALQFALHEPQTPGRMQDLLAGSFVHKLTYKYPPQKVSPDTVLGALMRSLTARPGRG